MFNFNLTNQSNSIINPDKLWDIIIVGAGPAGLNALLYAKRKGLDVILIAGEIGGQLNNTDLVDNYLGIESISGADLTKAYQKHVNTYKDYLLLNKKVTKIDKQSNDFYVSLDDLSQYKAKTVILATGGSPRKLGVSGELKYQAKGISYCTICDAPFFKDKEVVVAGGGNGAAESVIDLLKWASHVTLVHRSQFRADKILLDNFIHDPRVTIHLETQIEEITGDEKVNLVKVYDKLNKVTKEIKTDGVFVSVGVVPNTHLVKDLVELNDRTEVIVDEFQRTSLKGLYAVGDITNQPYKQIIISAAEGAKAALDIHRYLVFEYERK